MTAALLLASMFAATPEAAICELTYTTPSGEREVALRVEADGRATSMLRGELHTTDLGAATAARLRSRLNRYTVCKDCQGEFDQTLATDARMAGLQLPIPFADVCEITLTDGRAVCKGSAVLATRLPDNELVQQFERLRTELEQIRSIVIIGGPQEMSRFLRVGRSAIGDDVPLSAMVYADEIAGERVVHFRPAGQHGPLLIVSSIDGQRPVARVIDLNVAADFKVTPH